MPADQKGPAVTARLFSVFFAYLSSAIIQARLSRPCPIGWLACDLVRPQLGAQPLGENLGLTVLEVLGGGQERNRT